MKRSVHFLALFAGVVAASVAHAQPPKSYDAFVEASAVAARATLERDVARAGAVIASMDDKRGVPSFLWAVGSHPASTKVSAAAAARSHVVDFAAVYGLSPTALDAAEVVQVHDTGRGGIIVTLRQRMGGVELFQSDMKVLLRRNLELVAITGSLEPSASPSLKPGASPFKVADRDAVVVALNDLLGLSVTEAVLTKGTQREGGYRLFDLETSDAAKSAGVSFSSPARAKQVWYRVGAELVAAYFVEVHAGKVGDGHADYFRYVIAADDGRLLQRQSLTARDSFNYRVWADDTPLHTPLGGPVADFYPHPTGVPDGSQPAFIPPSLISMEGFNTNPNGEADPWLPSGAAQTVGNNVDAYADLALPDGFSNGDLRPTVTGPGTFDRTYDTSLAPDVSATQIMAGVTQSFYLINWLHDWWYDSGFDEAAGNAQFNNFGRGGLDNDRLETQAQDALDTTPYNYDNAYMSTPGDGASPVMHNFFWTGTDLVRTVELAPGGALGEIGLASFGPSAFDVTASVVLVDDGTAPTSDGCQVPQNAVAGSIALIDRGTCSFDDKVAAAESAGAVGVLIANHTAGAGVFAMGVGSGWPVNIPAMMVSYEDGVAMKAALANGPVSARMARQPGPERDGALDNMVTAHEWMHYMHNRVAPGNFLFDPNGNYFGMYAGESEGYADFAGLLMVLEEGDDLDGVYADSTYVGHAYSRDLNYYGIRRQPYSVDPDVNAVTFRHIANGEPLPPSSLPNGVPNAEGHQVGDVWGSMMFEAYVALQKRTQEATPPYDFAEGKRRMSDYLTAGMKLSPFSATFTEARDAIIAAALANDAADAQVLAEAFARRGVGSCAVAPDRASMDLVGVVESFELAPKAEVASITITPPDDCDNDVFLDANETGTLAVVVRNGGMEPLVGAQLAVATELAGVTFPDGATAAVPDVPALGSVTLELALAVDDGFNELTVLPIDATVTSTDTCELSTASTLQKLINADDVPQDSATERAESSIEVWSKVGAHADDIWSRAELSATEHVWNGIDYSVSSSDTSLESPDLLVGTEPLVISFDHSYSFEYGFDGTMVFWDGGVIELSEDGGQSWVDIASYADPGYTGVLFTGAGNVLGGRMGYAAKSDAFPAMHPVSLNIGTAFAGKTIRLRFRIGTDINTGAPGWLIDNIAFQGITNTPFASLVADNGQCSPPSTCGNGEIDQGEACDNGESNSDTAPDACRTSCVPADCGDGVLDTGELCDEGNDNSDTQGDACRTNCRPHRCGDGVADEGEECDDGIFNTNGPDACRANCAAPRCGDGVRDFGEECDDANGINGDLCTNECLEGPLSVEDGFFEENDARAASPRLPNKVYAEGCGCTVPGSGSGRGRAAQAMLLALGLALSSRRRRGGV